MSRSKKDNSFGGARSIGGLSGNFSQKGFVGQPDKTDFFTFSILGRSSVNASLSQLKANADLVLFNGDRQPIEKSTKKGKKRGVIKNDSQAAYGSSCP